MSSTRTALTCGDELRPVTFGGVCGLLWVAYAIKHWTIDTLRCMLLPVDGTSDQTLQADDWRAALGVTAKDEAELAQWDGDAFRIVVEVPTSKVTAEQLDAVYDAICDAVHAWEESLPERDWDPFIYGHGPSHRADQP